MLRRSSRSATALDQTKEELARQESELRGQVEKLERMIADAPRMAEEEARKQREGLRASGRARNAPVSMSHWARLINGKALRFHSGAVLCANNGAKGALFFWCS